MIAIIWEGIWMSVFVFGVGYGLYHYAFKMELQNDKDEVLDEDLEKTIKNKNDKYDTGNHFVDKWLEFGGGYYGTMALVKFIFLELGEIKEFVQEWPGLTAFIDSLGIDTIVRFFVEQFMNFLWAVMWIVDYLKNYHISEVAVFVGITWVTHEAARKYARFRLSHRETMGAE